MLVPLLILVLIVLLFGGLGFAVHACRSGDYTFMEQRSGSLPFKPSLLIPAVTFSFQSTTPTAVNLPCFWD